MTPRTLTLREFERIWRKAPRIPNGQQWLSPATFDSLETLVLSSESEPEFSSTSQFLQLGSDRSGNRYLRTQNYVGTLTLDDGTTIEILPKIDLGRTEPSNSDAGRKADEEAMAKTREIFLRMLDALPEFNGKLFSDATLETRRMSLAEVFIRMFLVETEGLVKRGLRSNYVDTEDNLTYFKGKLIIGEHIRRNAAHAERFYTAFDEFSTNIAENRLIKAALLALRKLTRNADSERRAIQLLTHFDSVPASTDPAVDFEAIHLDRMMARYERLISWTRIILRNHGFTPFAGASVAHSLLFPMESVYEAYVYQELRKVLAPDGWHVSRQGIGDRCYLFDSPRKLFHLEPDIVLRRDDGTLVVLDTKWKRLRPNNANYGISREDMYQMYAYSKKYGTPDIWLLYPLTSELRTTAGDIPEPRFAEAPRPAMLGTQVPGTTVTVHFVDLENIEESLEYLRKQLSE